jgi:hypothetical protein
MVYEMGGVSAGGGFGTCVTMALGGESEKTGFCHFCSNGI